MQSSGRLRGVVRVPRWIFMCTAVALIAFKAHGTPSSAVAAETARQAGVSARGAQVMPFELSATTHVFTDRKSTRLNSSHSQISYAVFCLKKKKNKSTDT